jgi:hypothetical protein
VPVILAPLVVPWGRQTCLATLASVTQTPCQIIHVNTYNHNFLLGTRFEVWDIEIYDGRSPCGLKRIEPRAERKTFLGRTNDPPKMTGRDIMPLN